MIQYPIYFKSQTQSQSGMNNNWQSVSGDIAVGVSIPPEFEGPGGALSPEDLFNQALTNCFVATFKVYAQMSKLEFQQVNVDSSLVVDLNESKKPVMKSVTMTIQIVKPNNPEKALMLAKKASTSGFILNSVKTECLFDIQVVES